MDDEGIIIDVHNTDVDENMNNIFLPEDDIKNNGWYFSIKNEPDEFNATCTEHQLTRSTYSNPKKKRKISNSISVISRPVKKKRKRKKSTTESPPYFQPTSIDNANFPDNVLDIMGANNPFNTQQIESDSDISIDIGGVTDEFERSNMQLLGSSNINESKCDSDAPIDVENCSDEDFLNVTKKRKRNVNLQRKNDKTLKERHKCPKCPNCFRYECPYCNYGAKFARGVSKHVKNKHHNKTIRVIDNWRSLGKTPEEKAKCEEFERNQNQNMKYFCDTCGNGFRNRELIIRHLRRRCEAVPKFGCSYCDMRSKRIDSVVRHIRNMHAGNDETVLTLDE